MSIYGSPTTIYIIYYSIYINSYNKFMNKFKKNVTFVIVTYRSQNVIHRCIKSIDSKIKIIVVENSNNFSIKR